MSRFFGIFISTLVNIMSTLLLVYIVISWFVSPYNKYREMLDRFMNVFLNPIRRILPNTGMFDLSPIILMLLLQFIETIANMFFR
ncbi:MAG: YggT family protein [Flexilinea sp.]|jgi:YggT family protein